MPKDADAHRRFCERSATIQGLVCSVTTNDNVDCFVASDSQRRKGWTTWIASPPSTGTVHLVALFAKEQARSCEVQEFLLGIKNSMFTSFRPGLASHHAGQMLK